MASVVVILMVAAILLRPTTKPSAPVRNDVVVESLEVGPKAFSTIYTIGGPEDDAGSTTVIWVTESSAEGDEP
jgi:hypothetical protein